MVDDGTATPGAGSSLRSRRKLESMREIQSVAIAQFTERGFDAVTVGDLASAVGTSESTLYRYFGTKEGLVTWQEYEPALQAALLRRLVEQPPVDAIRDAHVEALAPAFDVGQLARITFIYGTPQVHAAAVEQSYLQHASLSRSLVGATGESALAADVVAGACLSAVDVATDHWQQAAGKVPLDELLVDAFDALRIAAPAETPPSESR
ncbi:MAG: TetR family transcriptional regulator [Actinomycetota bacterium]